MEPLTACDLEGRHYDLEWNEFYRSSKLYFPTVCCFLHVGSCDWQVVARYHLELGDNPQWEVGEWVASRFLLIQATTSVGRCFMTA